MRALVLEGGASRGAYAMGAYKALHEASDRFQVIVGTSVGALNGAMIGQGDWQTAFELWRGLRFQDIFSANESYMEYLLLKRPSLASLPLYAQAAVLVAHSRGLDITPLKRMIAQYIDEEKLRTSGVQFGLTTINLSKRKIEQPFLSDMDEGQLTDYILATCYMPIFYHERLMGDYYLDGCFYDNMPWRMVQNMDVEDVTIIRLPTGGRVHLPVKMPNVRMITPSERLPLALTFHHTKTEPQLILGYMDAKKVLGDYAGQSYYFYQETMPTIAPDVLHRVEYIAKKLGIVRLRVYDWEEFLFRIYQDAYFQNGSAFRGDRRMVAKMLGM